MNIHEHMADKVELAAIYAQDGAFRTAADILEKLATDIRAHVDRCDAEMFAAGQEES